MQAPNDPGTSKLLIHEEPLQVLPSLAVALGDLNEAIVLQQLHYWLRRNGHERDDRTWIYNTYEDWHTQFPFWSISTIKRTILSLQKKDLVLTANYNHSAMDKTKWYAINYKQLNNLITPEVGDPIDRVNLTPSTAHIDPIDGSDCSHLFSENNSRDLEHSLTTFVSMDGDDRATITSSQLITTVQSNGHIAVKKTPRKKPVTPLAEDDWLRAVLLEYNDVIPFQAMNDATWWIEVSRQLKTYFNADWLRGQFSAMTTYFIERPHKEPSKNWKGFVRRWLNNGKEHDRRYTSGTQQIRRYRD
jgi:hypothetical protein